MITRSVAQCSPSLLLRLSTSGTARTGRFLVPLARAGTRREASSSAAPLAASALVKGEQEASVAAEAVVKQLRAKLGDRDAVCTIWFAKGYGPRAKVVGPLLQEKLGDGVVIGSNAEGGIIGDGCEVQKETFALAALALRLPGLSVFPFYAPDLSVLPELGRGGRWDALAEAAAPPVILAFCTLPSPPGADPQGWMSVLDNALTGRIGQRAGRIDSKTRRLSAVLGGLTVSDQVYVDGEVYKGGGFGVVLQAQGLGRGTHLDAVVCQGAKPFGPWLKITGIEGDHIITGLDDKNPREVLEPLLHSPEVPGTGHSMAGIFVDPKPADGVSEALSAAALAEAAMSGRPSCLVRPMHQFTPEGHLVISPLLESVPYEVGMQLQLNCYSQETAIEDLEARAEHDVALHEGPPDASLLVMCGARGEQLYSNEGVESDVLRKVWGQNVPTVGFFAGGEIGPVGLKTYLHGYTTCCLMVRGSNAPS